MSELMVKMRQWFSRLLGGYPDVRLLMGAALIRSAAQGMALVDISLYLRSLGWGGGEIGGVLAAAGVLRTVLTLFAGSLNARLGAKRMLLLFEALTAAGAAVAATIGASQPALLAAAIVASGLGSGHSGSGGPAAPIERSWLAGYARRSGQALIPRHARIGWFGMAAGAWLACLASAGGGSHPGPGGYRLVFGLLAALAAGGCVLLLRLKGGQRKPPEAAGGAAAEQRAGARSAGDDAVRAREGAAGAAPASVAAPAPGAPGQRRKGVWLPAAVCAAAVALSIGLQHAGLKQLSLYAPIAVFIAVVGSPFLRLLGSARREERTAEELKQLAHILGIVSATLTSTMTSFWFSAKFDVSPAWIGALMGLSYAGAGALSLLFESGADKRGRVAAIVTMQQVSIGLLLILPWASSFWLAAVLEIGCTACSLGTRGSRMEIQMEERGRGRRSLMSRIYYLIVRLGAVMWPGAFGRLVEEGQYVAPFYIAAALQAGSAFLYAKLNRGGKRSEDGAA